MFRSKTVSTRLPECFWTLMILVVALSIISAQSFAQEPAPSNSANPPFSLSISAAAGSVKVSEPVKLNVVLKNISAEDIRVWYDSLGQEKIYKVIVKNEKGSGPEETKFKRDLKGLENPAYITPDTPLNFSGASLTLKSGETVTDPINVSRLYTFTRGKYTIQVQRLVPTSGIFVTSNTITVTVTP